MDEEELFEDPETPISVIAEAFEQLAKTVSNSSEDLRLVPFSDACSLVSVLFGCLGIAFKFAELEYVSKNMRRVDPKQWDLLFRVMHEHEKSGSQTMGFAFQSHAFHDVRDLIEASKTYDTLRNILESDVENDTVRTQGSHSRNLRRVRQGLDLIRALFENFLSSDYCSLREAASTAYAQVCAPYHTWAVRTAAFAGMFALPSRQQLLEQLNETDHSVEKTMRRYIDAVIPVIEYIDKLYISKNIDLDW